MIYQNNHNHLTDGSFTEGMIDDALKSTSKFKDKLDDINVV